jgi:hypothetical protein
MRWITIPLHPEIEMLGFAAWKLHMTSDLYHKLSVSPEIGDLVAHLMEARV